jgi:hypothetical protein
MAKTFDDCGHPLAVGDKVHVHGSITALNGDFVNIRLDAPEGQEGQEITSVKSCCVHCDEPHEPA